MTIRFSDDAAHAQLAARRDEIDAGAGTSTVTIRTGGVPTNLTDVESGTLLCTINLSATSFGTPASRSMSANGLPLSGTAVAGGTAGHYRVFDGDGNIVEDGVIGADMTIDNAVIANGQTVNITAWSKSYA